MRLVNERNIEISDVRFHENLASLLRLIDSNVISGSIAKTVFEDCLIPAGSETIVEQKGLKQISDKDELVQIIRKVAEDNPKSVEDYKKGKKKLMGFWSGRP